MAETMSPSQPVRPAGVSTIAEWSGRDVSVADVTAAMTDLRHHHRAAAVQTSVLTLVVVARPEGIARAREVVDDLGANNPSRMVLISMDAGAGAHPPGSQSVLDASVALKVARREQTCVCFDEVSLVVRGPARYHLDSLVGPFALGDLPVVVWLPDDLPSTGDPLLGSVDRIVIDSRAVAQDRPDTFSRIAAIGRRLPVADLSWYRLESWRWTLAGLFTGVHNRRFLRNVEEVEVAGNFGPRTLLAGWLASRLALVPEQVRAVPAAHVAIRIEASQGGRHGTFTVARPSDERCLESSIEIEGRPSLRQVVRMRRRWPALALTSALTAVGPDETYMASLEASLALAGR